MLVLPNKSPIVWQTFLRDNKVLVYKYILKKLRRSIRDSEQKVQLFKFAGDKRTAWIPRENYMGVLKDTMNIFIEHEEYEFAQKTKETIDLLHIDNVINESVTPK